MDSFFHNSELLDYLVLRPLSHITLNWEMTWNHDLLQYEEEEYSFAGALNELLEELDSVAVPENYHEHEDKIAQNVIDSLNWEISKTSKRWIGADYASILEQGAFGDVDQRNMLVAAKGRIEAAKKFGQHLFDNMEQGHRQTLSQLLTVILFQRADLSKFN